MYSRGEGIVQPPCEPSSISAAAGNVGDSNKVSCTAHGGNRGRDTVVPLSKECGRIKPSSQNSFETNKTNHGDDAKVNKLQEVSLLELLIGQSGGTRLSGRQSSAKSSGGGGCGAWMSHTSDDSDQQQRLQSNSQSGQKVHQLKVAPTLCAAARRATALDDGAAAMKTFDCLWFLRFQQQSTVTWMTMFTLVAFVSLLLQPPPLVQAEQIFRVDPLGKCYHSRIFFTNFYFFSHVFILLVLLTSKGFRAFISRAHVLATTSDIY